MRLAVIMPCFNELAVTKQTVESLFAETAEPDFTLILVNDGSTDGTTDYINGLQAKYGDDRVEYRHHLENLGVTAAWNTGVRIAQAQGAPYVAIVNNDILFTAGWDVALINALEVNSTLAVVSPLSTHDKMPRDWPAGSGRHPNPAHYMGYMPILGEAFMCRTALFDEIGLFPEALKIYFGDNWLVLASQAKGYECDYVPDSYIHHLFRRTTRALDNEAAWAHDEAAFEKLAKEIGVSMKPYCERVK